MELCAVPPEDQYIKLRPHCSFFFSAPSSTHDTCRSFASQQQQQQRTTSLYYDDGRYEWKDSHGISAFLLGMCLELFCCVFRDAYRSLALNLLHGALVERAGGGTTTGEERKVRQDT